MGARCAELRFTIAVTATFDAVSLAIADGPVTSCGGGECAVSIRLLYKETDLSGAIKAKTIKLPGRYVFPPPGLAIP